MNLTFVVEKCYRGEGSPKDVKIFNSVIRTGIRELKQDFIKYGNDVNIVLTENSDTLTLTTDTDDEYWRGCLVRMVHGTCDNYAIKYQMSIA